jgi:hypothetical protein
LHAAFIRAPLACAGLLLAATFGVQAAPPAYAGAWFQCQPRWSAEKNHLLVDVKKGDRAWDAHWGAGDSARGTAEKDKDGNLGLRGCHAIAGKPSKNCNAAKPPLFATLPKAAIERPPLPIEEALRRGTWIHTEKAMVDQLAAQCAALRPRPRQ